MTSVQGVDKLVGIVEVRPGEHVEMPLGDFETNQSPMGFCVMVESDPRPGALVMQTVKLKKGTGYEFILEVANNGKQTLMAEIFQMHQQKQGIAIGAPA